MIATRGIRGALRRTRPSVEVRSDRPCVVPFADLQDWRARAAERRGVRRVGIVGALFSAGFLAMALAAWIVPGPGFSIAVPAQAIDVEPRERKLQARRDLIELIDDREVQARSRIEVLRELVGRIPRAVRLMRIDVGGDIVVAGQATRSSALDTLVAELRTAGYVVASQDRKRDAESEDFVFAIKL